MTTKDMVFDFAFDKREVFDFDIAFVMVYAPYYYTTNFLNY